MEMYHYFLKFSMATHLVLYWLIDRNICDEYSCLWQSISVAFFVLFLIFCSKSFRTLPDSYMIASEVVFPSATLCFSDDRQINPITISIMK
ncbi:hypothetical protein PRUPE_2G045400 [Prunus persica]|uniref:Uncharacterized protein n=1 Tax=Prunus persica TaxID=3760 RepID=A0A251QAY6_PRUPE|nr:hypothetical protein PRUPE_2G045400 [Prunus persica]